VLFALETSCGMRRARAFPIDYKINTLLLTLVEVGGPNDTALIINDNDSLDILMRLHAIKRLFDLGHIISCTN
jgi:hypothetical protein